MVHFVAVVLEISLAVCVTIYSRILDMNAVLQSVSDVGLCKEKKVKHQFRVVNLM